MTGEIKMEPPIGEESSAAVRYRDEALGRFSSHPYWLIRGSRALTWLIVGVFTLAYLLAFWVWLRSHAITDLLTTFVKWIGGTGGKFGLGIAAFAIGMLCTSAFQLRWAMRQYRNPELGPGNDAPAASLNLPLLALFALIALVIPLVLTFAPGLPIEVRMLGPFLALLPVGFLSYFVSSRDDPVPHFPWFLCLISPVLWGIVFVSWCLVWLQEHLPLIVIGIFPMLGTIEGIRNALIALATTATLIGLFRLVRWVSRRGPSQSQELIQIQEGGEDAVVDPIVGIAAILKVSPDTVVKLTPETEEIVDWQDQSEFEAFFEGHRLTQDQHKLIANFCHLSDSVFVPGSQDDEFSISLDMIVEGPSGSGRSATLDAIGLLSVISRGAAVVVFVPDEGRATIVIQRLLRKIAYLHLTDFVVAGSLDCANHPEMVPPEICVTTMHEWESRLVGRLDQGDAAFNSVRALMSRYTTVLVDDFIDHPLPERFHLPFVIDKHRLLLESQMIPSIRVFAFSRLTESGRGLVIDRLIGHGGVRDEARQVHRLRYRQDLAASVFEVESDHVGETIERLALDLCKAGKSSVLVRRGVDAEEASRQTEELRSRSQTSNITVCYCNDQLDTIIGELSSIVMKAADGPDAVFALRSRRPEDGIVMIRVRNPREMELPVRITPLLVDRSARGMAEAHLQSILRFIDYRVPIAQRAWGQLGAPGRIGEASVDGSCVGRLLLDQPEGVSEIVRRDRPYLRKVGSFMALDQRFTRYAPVDCQMVPDSGLPWWAEGGDTRFGPDKLCLPALPAEGTSRRTTVLWKGNDGAELGRSQLHYLDDLILRRRQVFSPDHFEFDETSGIEIRAMRFRDNGQDGIHPKFEFRWTMVDEETDPASSKASGKHLMPMPGTGGPDHGYLWVEYPIPAGREIFVKLVQRTDDLDRPTPCGEFEFSYRASLRPLLLVPKPEVIDQHAEFQNALSDLFSNDVEWGTGNEHFLPGVTYALTRALELELPSTSFFGKILAFQLDGSAAKFASAIVWFVEPQGTGATLSNAVHELFRDESYLDQLANRMDKVIALGWDKSPPIDLARFWLPERLRTGVVPFERTLFWSLMKQRSKKHKGEMALTPTLVRIACPYCKQDFEREIGLIEGAQFEYHCDHVVAMIVPSERDMPTTPRVLVDAWWPPGVPVSRGSTSQLVNSVRSLIAQRVVYQNDKFQLEGLEDCWYSPAVTWSRQEGDCEDHAILMVAMLRKVGVKSWLTWGEVDVGPHAWVEAEIEGRCVIVEATSKEPLEEQLPTVGDDDATFKTLRWKYRHGLFTPIDQTPSRTNGVGYDIWRDGKWEPAEFADIELISGTDSAIRKSEAPTQQQSG